LRIIEEFPRLFSVETSGKSFETPFFIPAISSIKADWELSKYVDLIQKVGYPSILISAYDIHELQKKEKETLMETISTFAEKRVLVFLDNGNYEAYWYKEKTWTLEKFKTVLSEAYSDFCFSFDIFWNKEKSVRNHIDETITSIAKTASMQKTGSIIALIHSNPKLFPEVTRKIADYINPEIIAIPERELGFSIFERSQTIKAIRRELDKVKKSMLIHVLGTGNPISILIYTLSGADMYDALDWSNAFVNPTTGQFSHFSHKDLIDCHCKACEIKQIPYDYQAMAHNLVFYVEFLDNIKTCIKDKNIESLLNRYMSEKKVSRIKRMIELK